MNTRLRPTRNNGYSLVEALVASALLGAMIGGAVSMVGTMNLSERTAYTGTVALNMQDCAAHLWQLGLSPAEVLSVLPSNTDNEFVDGAVVASSANAVAFGTAGTTVLSNVGTVENIPCTVTIKDPQGVNNRGTTVQVYRPSLR